MSDQPEINLLDDEYMTPAQREALRKSLEPQPEATPQVTQGDGSNTWAQWLADVELHRRTNGTTGQESEE